MKTMQTAGRGKAAKILAEWDVTLARADVREAYGEARFELKSLRSGRQYRTDAVHREYAARMKVQHDLARAALRNLNALKAPKPACTVCGECEPIAAYGGWCCAKALKAEVTP